VLQGLCDTFDRYREFLDSFYLVKKAYSESKINSKQCDVKKIEREFNNGNDIKSQFEQSLNDEVKVFVEKYSDEYPKIIETYKLLIKSINSGELGNLQNYTSFYK
jgi:hypothetical protein